MNDLYIGIVIGLLSPIAGIFAFRLLVQLPSLISGSIKSYFTALRSAVKVA